VRLLGGPHFSIVSALFTYPLPGSPHSHVFLGSYRSGGIFGRGRPFFLFCPCVSLYAHFFLRRSSSPFAFPLNFWGGGLLPTFFLCSFSGPPSFFFKPDRPFFSPYSVPMWVIVLWNQVISRVFWPFVSFWSLLWFQTMCVFLFFFAVVCSFAGCSRCLSLITLFFWC